MGDPITPFPQKEDRGQYDDHGQKGETVEGRIAVFGNGKREEGEPEEKKSHPHDGPEDEVELPGTLRDPKVGARIKGKHEDGKGRTEEDDLIGHPGGIPEEEAIAVSVDRELKDPEAKDIENVIEEGRVLEHPVEETEDQEDEEEDAIEEAVVPLFEAVMLVKTFAVPWDEGKDEGFPVTFDPEEELEFFSLVQREGEDVLPRGEGPFPERSMIPRSHRIHDPSRIDDVKGHLVADRAGSFQKELLVPMELIFDHRTDPMRGIGEPEVLPGTSDRPESVLRGILEKGSGGEASPGIRQIAGPIGHRVPKGLRTERQSVAGGSSGKTTDQDEQKDEGSPHHSRNIESGTRKPKRTGP
jgi:hypothetical protein